MRSVELNQTWTTASALTALIDVIFLLLMFFVCVSQYEPTQNADEVTLAHSTRGNRPDPPTPTTVTISFDQHGMIAWNNQSLSMPQIQQKLNELSKQNLELSLIIRADHRCLFDSIDPLLRHCEQIGIKDIQFPVLANPRQSQRSGGTS